MSMTSGRNKWYANSNPIKLIAKAKDLKSARAAFQPLSDAFIKFLADNKAKVAHVQVYCPMAKANRLQTDKNVSNSYLGKAMPDWGEIQN
jgi:hypothetical protein